MICFVIDQPVFVFLSVSVVREDHGEVSGPGDSG